MLSLLGLLLVSGCTQAAPPARKVSRESRELCRERAAQASTISAAQAQFRDCLKTVEAERVAVRPSPPPPVEPPSAIPTDRYLHCLMVQREVIATEKRRLQVKSRWIVASSSLPSDDPDFIAAKRAYEKVISDFERLIPPEVRSGAPLLPDAVRTFQRCDRAELRPE